MQWRLGVPLLLVLLLLTTIAPGLARKGSENQHKGQRAGKDASTTEVSSSSSRRRPYDLTPISQGNGSTTAEV